MSLAGARAEVPVGAVSSPSAGMPAEAAPEAAVPPDEAGRRVRADADTPVARPGGPGDANMPVARPGGPGDRLPQGPDPGRVPSSPAPPSVGELPAPPAVAEMPPPITDAAELAEEIVALFHERTAIRWERVLSGLVALYAGDDRAGLAASLRPVADRYANLHTDRPDPGPWGLGLPTAGLAVAIRAATGDAGPHQRELVRRLTAAVRVAWQEGRRGRPDAPFAGQPIGVLAVRVAEMAAQLTGSMVPMTVSTPTHVSGHVDGAVLLDRLRHAEAEGWQPWPFDFEQALLRVPRDTPAAVAAEAARLTSPAGRQFAQWLATGGLPDPVSAAFPQYGTRHEHLGHTWDDPVPRRVVATLRPARDGGLRLERQLLTLNPPKSPVHLPGEFTGVEDVLAMVVPDHREVAAAWALADVAALADQGRRGAARLLPLLAGGGGPAGPALCTALAYGLGAKDEPDRAAAVDAFRTLAASAVPFAAGVGTALADLTADGTVKLSRIVPALTDAHRTGASAAVWDLLLAVLPALLPTTVRAVPDLLDLAGQVAATLGARDEIPGLTAAASRSDSTRLAKEARRLHNILTA
ncbi:DUF6493 family protein [Actinoplanes sp. DH11]|uniref:DUF7824 domain-containing protein n=1 Tax=Actinoplanes sp. DH11 TaxID=2857011 RepID=UPI002714D067|nr:DUF6493 family protein [Actinoplanes sp. DH11]